ncbi:MAG TPA: VOC family protein [Methanobacteriaceae archaeon]|nr:VOC family protein [Methanobacteriaceae archaeon]
MSKVIHFEIPADDPERAAKFYEDVFGWKITKWDGPFDYWLITAGEDDEMGINGAIMSREFGAMVRDTISVDSYDEFVKKIEKEGGKMLTEKLNIPGIGDMGSFQDTEGNVFAILETKMD